MEETRIPLTDSEELSRYVELTSWIRELSAPEITEDIGAENYRKKLLSNFTRIGELSRVNGDILKHNIFPLLEQEGLLSAEDEANLRRFNEALLDATNLVNLDTPMMYLDARRLLSHADVLQNTALLIASLFDVITSAYTMLFMTIRLYPCSDICFHYRDIGLKAAARILTYLPPESFAQLPDNASRERVLIVSRYIFSMFSRQDAFGDERINREDYETLVRALKLAEDPFYLGEAKEYDWNNHRFRTMQYLCDLTERNNERGLSADILQDIAGTAKKMDALWRSDEEYYGEFAPREVMDLLLMRTAYLAGEMSLSDYRGRLLKLMKKRNDRDFSYQSILLNVSAPIEYMCTFRGAEPSREEKIHISSFYHNLIGYIHHMPKRGAITFLLTDLSEILKHFIPVDDAVSFEELCMSLLAALHPPTYVHSLSVADISACLASHLIRQSPESFIGVFGIASAEEALRKAEDLTKTARHAGLLHDVGKLFIVETIITYGRPLFDLEFDWIKTHPSVGGYLLSLYPETEKYAGVAALHHKWYDDSRGYPESETTKKRADKMLIDIVAIADCLDAATDTVGRSYKSGKTLRNFLEEVREEKGKRFSPVLCELLARPEVQADIESILAYGRDENYRNAYRIMKGV